MDIVKSFENDIDIMKNNRIDIVFETETESDTKIEIETMKAEIKLFGIFTAPCLYDIESKCGKCFGGCYVITVTTL